ncbi:phosphoglucomutase [Desulfopila sp. IMCC35006]|uniref:phosphoglucomutase n=1 Tax=Desulfopila sp. IMCC35006 TaxID=2569542 RepID=UPI0010AC1AB1|nr:phosphoglucomutase [Desulfopila sp. IMCC35006]TKB27629.1 phosphoglucomutase [Desulfopila sp. IMCC35006]
MSIAEKSTLLFDRFTVKGNHAESDYFGLIKELVANRQNEGAVWQQPIDAAYDLVRREILENQGKPTQLIAFGTSGWRGKLGKDVFCHSVALVTTAIVQMYQAVDSDPDLGSLLGVKSLAEAQKRGCVLGFDNRFAGELLACQVASVLSSGGFTVQYAGESTTGVLSAAVLEKRAAFSINLTPSHNPLEYGGYKFNAADAGPAASEITARITGNARALAGGKFSYTTIPCRSAEDIKVLDHVQPFDSLECWKNLVQKNHHAHGLDLNGSIGAFLKQNDMVIAVDCVHGASRLHIHALFNDCSCSRLILLRNNADVTFGGVAPEPSTANMQEVVRILKERKEPLKLGAIIDPDGDRIRFTDGHTEIGMNQFGAMAYHFLHEYKKKKGMVAKTVATSNLANSIAENFQEELFEPSVGFKNFKPVIGSALVYFEESDGISIIGHTPEKDAYIGLLLALEMMLATKMNLGDYLREIEGQFGAFYPDRDGIEVRAKGEELQSLLAGLEKYGEGSTVAIGDSVRRIRKVITIDGRKMVFEDGSWLMIRASGTEPKVRFYVESRTASGTAELVTAAKAMLTEIGIL